jgi:hypothetical protein
MSPVSSIKDRQFAFVLTAEEHDMLTKLADVGEVSASEWLRGQIRAEFGKGLLATLSQRISRTRDAFAQEHREYLRRVGERASMGLRAPEHLVLNQRVEELRALVKAQGSSALNFDRYAGKYEAAVHRATRQGHEPADEKELQAAFDMVWMLLDDWKERSRAAEAAAS